jgi:hypothetical protein
VNGSAFWGIEFWLVSPESFFEQRFCAAIWKSSLSGASILKVIASVRCVKDETAGGDS